MCVSQGGQTVYDTGASGCSSDATSQAVSFDQSEAFAQNHSQAVAIDRGVALAKNRSNAVALNRAFAFAFDACSVVALNGEGESCP